MSEWDNGQALSQQDQRPLSICGSDSEAAQGFTAERVLRIRPKTYRAVVQLLAEPRASVNQIAKLHRVSTHTVRAIRHREAQDIAERKKTLAGMLANVAELGAGRMEETIGKASLRDATIGTGVAVDKLLALTGQSPAVQVAVVNMPSEAERAELSAIDAKLDEIARRLAAAQAPDAE
jgi:transposase-like protein